MKKNIYILFAILAYGVTSAQYLPDYLRAGAPSDGKFIKTAQDRGLKKHRVPRLQSTVTKNYNVISYDLFMDWYHVMEATGVDSSDKFFNGANKITLVVDSASAGTLVFDAVDLLISKVIADGKEIIPVPLASENGYLSIKLPTAAKKGDTIRLEISYNYVHYDPMDQQKGLYVYPKGYAADYYPKPSKDTVFLPERIAYTMSEPEEARYWMPCNDMPSDKARGAIAVRVPDGYNVCSNGLLDSVRTDSGSKTYYWSDTTQVATYLMSANASKFAEYSDYYQRLSNPQDSVEIQYWIWEKDFLDTTTTGMEYNAHTAFRQVPKMVKALSSILGEYPYSKYGMVAVQDFDYGGMEHQTLTTIHRNWLRAKNRGGGNSDWGNQLGIVHELGHQWLGDLITCSTWKDIWINEGGASWIESLWLGYSIKNSYIQTNNFRGNYLYYNRRGEQPPIYGISLDNLFNYPTTYCKAALIYHMLNKMYGDSIFIPALKSIIAKYKFSSLTTDQFKTSLGDYLDKMGVAKTETDSTVELDTFFNQWLIGAGHPQYEISLSSHENQPGKYSADVTLNQVQQGVKYQWAEVFHTPVKILLFCGDSVVTKKAMNNLRTQSYYFDLPAMADSVKIDSMDVLCETISTVSSVSETKIDSGNEMTVSPNPVVSGSSCNLDIKSSGDNYAIIEIYDNLGNLVQELYRGYLSAKDYRFSIQTKGKSTGVYYIYSRIGDKSYSTKFSLLN